MVVTMCEVVTMLATGCIGVIDDGECDVEVCLMIHPRMWWWWWWWIDWLAGWLYVCLGYPRVWWWRWRWRWDVWGCPRARRRAG